MFLPLTLSSSIADCSVFVRERKGDDGDRGSLDEHLDSVRTNTADGKVRTPLPPLLEVCPVSEETSWGGMRR